jgi:hypothetical protein
MKNNNHEKLKMPKHLDDKLRASFRRMFLSQMAQKVKLSFPDKIFRQSLITIFSLILIVGVASVGVIATAPGRYAEAATKFAYNDIRLQSEVIKHQQIAYSEGDDKVAFSHNLGDFEDDSVVYRSEVVERWQHGNHSLGVVDSSIPGTTVGVHFNYENDGHIHVFEYQPKSCEEQSSLKIDSQGCKEQRKLTKEEQEARKLLDEAHDLGTLYTSVTGFAPEESSVLLSWIENMEYLGKEKFGNNDKRSLFVTQHSEELKSILHFNIKTGRLVEREIYVITPEKEYEMTVVVYGDIEWIPAKEAGGIFNPEAFPFNQIEVIPLSA